LGKHNTQKKDHSQKKFYQNQYCAIASDVWETDNPIHKLVTEKVQPV